MNEGMVKIEEDTKALGLTSEYKDMLAIVRESAQAIAVATAQHGKSHSQFQYAMLDCAGPLGGLTKLRNWRQILAVIERTRDALEDASFKLGLQQVKIKKLRGAIDITPASDIKSETLQIKLQEAECHVERLKRNMAGAIRKLTTYTLQFRELERQIRMELNKADDEPITEEEFERDEERFHIMKAFQQGLTAARAHGRIDHGNMIYFDDIGISGTMAQEDVKNFLDAERVYRDKNPGYVHEVHGLECDFLFAMAKKYAGCAEKLARAKGLLPGILHEATLRLYEQTGEHTESSDVRVSGQE